MFTLKSPLEKAVFIRHHLGNLVSNISSLKNVYVSIGIEDKIFDETNFKEFFSSKSSWHSIHREEMSLDPEKYFESGRRHYLPVHPIIRNEASEYMTYATIYIINPNIFFQIELLQEFKNKGQSLFHHFTFTSGEIDKQAFFKERINDWEEGIKSALLSFKEALSNMDEFIKKRCNKAA